MKTLAEHRQRPVVWWEKSGLETLISLIIGGVMLTLAIALKEQYPLFADIVVYAVGAYAIGAALRMFGDVILKFREVIKAFREK